MAIDCARSALRQGQKVSLCIIAALEEEMPARAEEIEEAQEEGVEFYFCASPPPIRRKRRTSFYGDLCYEVMCSR